jgi:hypothetical protein
MPHGILQVFIIILYENVFQNPAIFPTQSVFLPSNLLYIVGGPGPGGEAG